MTRKIIDIRPVGIAPHLRLIADVKDRPDLLPYSVEIDALTPDELIIYAVTDPAHILNAQQEVEWDSDTVFESVTVTKPQIIGGVSSQEWWDAQPEVSY